MSNSPLGPLPLKVSQILAKIQKINAASASKTIQKATDDLYFFLKQPQKVQINEIRTILKPSTKHYGAAIFLDLLILIIVLNLGFGPASKMITPWVESLQTQNSGQGQIPNKLFAFAPGGSLNKLGKVRVEGLSTLAFFDIAVNRDGTLNQGSSSYLNFRSEQAANLFSKAHDKGVKVVVTLSQIDNGEISQILNDSAAQQNIINESIAQVKDTGIDGVNLDFEYTGLVPWGAKGKYAQFIKNFSDQMHSQVPGSILTVSVPNSGNSDFYDLHSISERSDQVLMIAYTVPVPETRNASVITPVFDGATDYFSRLSQAIGSLFYQLPEEKFQMETAWYGNGNNYPLYIPKVDPQTGGAAASVGNTLQTPLSDDVTNSLLTEVPSKSRDAARKNLPYIAKALQDEGILNQNVLAYALATVEHETAGTFEPVDEIKGRRSARRLGYEGGTDYFGRGFIQLTHLRNYKVVGARIGMGDELVKNPDLATKPEVAAKVLAAFFKDNNVANLATRGSFVAARNPVNPDAWAYSIAQIAYRYLYAIA